MSKILCIFVFVAFSASFIISECSGQLASQQVELEQPLSAVVKFTSWMEVFGDDFDLEVTVHYGGADGDSRTAFYETICKSRQIYDQKKGVAFTTWATGSTEIDVKQGTGNDFRDRRVRVLEDQMVKELNFLENLEKPIGRCKDECIRQTSPIDIRQSVTNFRLLDLTIAKSSDLSVFMDRLATLKQSQLTTSKERIKGREMLVYRIKGDTSPRSIAIPVHRIVVSNSGFDNGLINEIQSSFIGLEERSKYQDEGQLDEAKGNLLHSVRWKEVSLLSRDGKTRKIVLPVSVSKRDDCAQVEHKGYFNMELIWRSFGNESESMCSVDACDKLSKEFLAKIDNTLGR